MSKHTEGEVEDTGNSEVIKIQNSVTLETIAFLKPGYPINKANAEHIVKCWNNYPAMYEALKNIVKEDWDNKYITQPTIENAKVILDKLEEDHG